MDLCRFKVSLEWRGRMPEMQPSRSSLEAFIIAELALIGASFLAASLVGVSGSKVRHREINTTSQ